MKIKTKDLTGDALDWAVGDIEFKRFADMGSPVKKWVLDDHNKGLRTDPYSTNWLFGGPLIEGEGIHLYVDESKLEWVSSCWGATSPPTTALHPSSLLCAVL